MMCMLSKYALFQYLTFDILVERACTKQLKTRLQENKRISLRMLMVSSEPRLQLYCAWSLNRNIESELLLLFLSGVLKCCALDCLAGYPIVLEFLMPVRFGFPVVSGKTEPEWSERIPYSLIQNWKSVIRNSDAWRRV